MKNEKYITIHNHNTLFCALKYLKPSQNTAHCINRFNILNSFLPEIIYLVRTRNIPKNFHFLHLDTYKYMCVSGDKNLSLENFAYVLND